MNRLIGVIICLITFISADETYTKNKQANKLFADKKYEQAIKLYNDALLANPSSKTVEANRASTLLYLGKIKEAEEAYKNAITIADPKTRAKILYNFGTAYNMIGDAMMQSKDPQVGSQVLELYKKAKKTYMRSLDDNSFDRDTKWNLQITNEKIKQLEQQQPKDQQKNKDDKNQDKKDKNKDKNKEQQDCDKQNDDSSDKQENDNEQKKQDDKQKENDDKQNQPKDTDEMNKENNDSEAEPKPQTPEEELEKQKALMLLMQYADDAKELNKPPKKMKKTKGKKPEKDW